MTFDTPLIPATLIRRYKRFLADVTLNDGSEVNAHVANPGSMMGLAEPGMRVWVEPNDDPKRKLKYAWKLAEPTPGVFVSVDTGMANRIVAEALHNGLATELGYTDIRREVKYGENSRIDFLLSAPGKPDCYLEVKSVTLSRKNGIAEFPDSVTVRGAKHMRALGEMAQNGHRAILLYLVQRNDCTAFRVAGDIDPAYQNVYFEARDKGVEVLCFGTDLSDKGISIATPITVDI